MTRSLDKMMKSCGIEPREITFAEPWQARAFALALALAERSEFAWDEFRQRLIDEIAKSDDALAAGRNTPGYYECWLAALEASITAKNLASFAEIERRANRIAADPPAPTKSSSAGPIKIA
jgi:nitrile hydratase accessory protein